MGAVEWLKENVISKVEDALLDPVETLEPIEGRRSEILVGKVSTASGEFKVIEQNKLKTNSRFAKLALEGHDVAWVISPDGLWYLVVDGKWCKKEKVSNDGELLPDAEV